MLETPGTKPSAVSDPPLLDARSVGETAERAVLSIALPMEKAFEALHRYVAVDEPAVHLMPLHFLPRSSHSAVERGCLHPLGVAAKLEYARSRWIDEVVDVGPMENASVVHRLHGALLDLVFAKYSEALRDRAGLFFRTLVDLYARHTVSVAVDGSRARTATVPLTAEEYSAQVSARNESFRASVDAVLLLAGASEEIVRAARESWRLWVLGAQLYDDALDAEEDFESDHSTWTVARTLADLHGDGAGDRRPDQDAFYEAALMGGALTETLLWAESCFESAARLAETEFPSWAALQQGCITQTSRLRGDFQKLTAETAQR